MAVKKCIKVDDNQDSSIRIYIDFDIISKILKEVHSKKARSKKFKLIVGLIYRNGTNRAIYEKYRDYPGTSVFKLTKGNENIRIYCKVEEKTDSKTNEPFLAIVLSEFYKKQTQGLSKTIIKKLESIQKRTYEYHEKAIPN